MKDRKYLDWLREQQCFFSGFETTEYEAVDPCHPEGGGMGMKASDQEACPAQHSLHARQHQIGWPAFLIEQIEENPRMARYLMQCVGHDYFRRYQDEQS
jgi:hypothetical protein